MFSTAQLIDPVVASQAAAPTQAVNATQEPIIWFLQTLVTILVIFVVMLTVQAYQTWFERKSMARAQLRYGPNRTGPIGLLQPAADLVKMLIKERIVPREADKAVFTLAPLLSFVPAMAALVLIPFGDTRSEGLLGGWVRPAIADLNVGILYILAFSSVGVYGIIMAGYSSGNKYSMLGALRSSGQVISYELTLGLSLMGVLIQSGSLRLNDIVLQQQASVWFVFPQAVGFLVFMVSGIAETNRTPFDLPEAESELVAGFHLEYSGIFFGMFYVAEYFSMNVIAILAAVMFFGGWAAPAPFLDFIPGPFWLFGKFALFLFLYYWLRFTVPRFRYDQLMGLVWKVMFPLALANLVITGIVKIIGIQMGWWL